MKHYVSSENCEKRNQKDIMCTWKGICVSVWVKYMGSKKIIY